MPPHRHGGQAQYIESPMPPAHPSDPFTDTLAWLEAHISEHVTVEDLARRAAMSPRTFARRFRAGTGTTPYRWLLHQRLTLARRLLESGDQSVDLVAAWSGFSTATNLRKHFNAEMRTSPQAYRRAFRATGDARP